jgi:hypothetical protein
MGRQSNTARRSDVLRLIPRGAGHSRAPQPGRGCARSVSRSGLDKASIAGTVRILHNLRMAEKIVLLLGDIAHEGVTSQLSTGWSFV